VYNLFSEQLAKRLLTRRDATLKKQSHNTQCPASVSAFHNNNSIQLPHASCNAIKR